MHNVCSFATGPPVELPFIMSVALPTGPSPSPEVAQRLEEVPRSEYPRLIEALEQLMPASILVRN